MKQKLIDVLEYGRFTCGCDDFDTKLYCRECSHVEKLDVKCNSVSDRKYYHKIVELLDHFKGGGNA